MLKRRLHRLFCVNTCQNATLLEISCHGSFTICNVSFLLSDAFFSQLTLQIFFIVGQISEKIVHFMIKA